MNEQKQANADMIEGYLDAYDLDAPEPSANRSHSYRHGFALGRSERLHHKPLADAKTLHAAADAAMAKDEAR
jgi:hypothetical protein